MRSFSFLPVLATLAFSAFTSAAPSPAPAVAVVDAHAKADVLLRRDADLERRCVPCDFFQGVITKIEVEVQAIGWLLFEFLNLFNLHVLQWLWMSKPLSP